MLAPAFTWVSRDEIAPNGGSVPCGQTSTSLAQIIFYRAIHSPFCQLVAHARPPAHDVLSADSIVRSLHLVTQTAFIQAPDSVARATCNAAPVLISSPRAPSALLQARLDRAQHYLCLPLAILLCWRIWLALVPIPESFWQHRQDFSQAPIFSYWIMTTRVHTQHVAIPIVSSCPITGSHSSSVFMTLPHPSSAVLNLCRCT